MRAATGWKTDPRGRLRSWHAEKEDHLVVRPIPAWRHPVAGHIVLALGAWYLLTAWLFAGKPPLQLDAAGRLAFGAVLCASSLLFHVHPRRLEVHTDGEGIHVRRWRFVPKDTRLAWKDVARLELRFRGRATIEHELVARRPDGAKVVLLRDDWDLVHRVGRALDQAWWRSGAPKPARTLVLLDASRNERVDPRLARRLAMRRAHRKVTVAPPSPRGRPLAPAYGKPGHPVAQGAPAPGARGGRGSRLASAQRGQAAARMQAAPTVRQVVRGVTLERPAAAPPAPPRRATA
ncbi:MAG TPA: hypothetical protein VFH47_05535 [Candidatus Thermoplasmatota archaeon]|nr:hypothetical protein [Candidatus Thermoplasmatota archaeon]